MSYEKLKSFAFVLDYFDFCKGYSIFKDYRGSGTGLKCIPWGGSPKIEMQSNGSLEQSVDDIEKLKCSSTSH